MTPVRWWGRGGSDRRSPTLYFVTYRLLTGAGRREAASMSDLHEILSDLRGAGASDITVVDNVGRLVTFDLGGTN